MAKPKPKYTKVTRDWHEEMAISSAKAAANELTWTRNCGPDAVYALARAERNIAHARTHLASIGFGRANARTKRLWAFVNRRDRQVEEAANRVARCMIKKR